MLKRASAKKSLGQHFLSDSSYCRRIVDFAGIRAGDSVLEIGPGSGQLTRLLLQRCRRLIAIEFDADLIALLKAKLASEAWSKLELIQADILKLNWADLLPEPKTKLVGNLPYNIATRVITQMTQIADRFHHATVMVQKEVGQRILAVPGSSDFGYLTVIVAYHFRACKGFEVPPGAFSPPPKVVSQVLQLRPRKPEVEAASYAAFRRLVSSAFRQRRKTLWNNLKGGFSTARLESAFTALGLDRSARPQEVAPEDFVRLSNVL